MSNKVARAYATSLVSGVGYIPGSTKAAATIITIIELLIPLVSRLRCFNPNNDGYDAMAGLRVRAAKNFEGTVAAVATQLVRASKKEARDRVRGVRDKALKQQILEHWTLTDTEAKSIAEYEVTRAMQTSGSSDKTANMINLL